MEENKYSPLSAVREFHAFYYGEHSQNISDVIQRRLSLIHEEYEEVSEALLDLFITPGKVEMHSLALELADLLYVVYGTADELGIPLEEVFSAVHTNNMSKVWDDGTVHYNSLGKVLKPPSYTPLSLSFEVPQNKKYLYGD